MTSVHAYNDVRIFLKECVSLKEKGYEVHLIAPGIPAQNERGIFLHGVAKPQGSRLSRMVNTSKLIYHMALSIDADIYHFHDPELLPIGLLLKKRGKKVIYDAHEDLPRQLLTKHWIPSMLRKTLSVLIEKFENYSAKKLDAVVAATPLIEKRFKDKGCNTINVSNFPLLEEFLNSGFRRTPKNRNVCYVGGINRVRGIFEMIEGVSKANAILLLGGRYADRKEKELVNNLQGYSHVKELDYLTRDQVAEVYSESHAGLVLLHPTKNYVDSLPVKLFEYMACGLPVIASDFPLWKEIVEDNRCGVCVDPLNTDEIAAAITRFIHNAHEAEVMGENGRQAVLRRYNWENERIKLFSIYEQLIHK